MSTELLRAWAIAFRTVESYGASHPSGRAALEALATQLPSCTVGLHVVQGAVFVDRKLVVPSLEVYRAFMHFGSALQRASISGVVVEPTVAPGELGELFGALLSRSASVDSFESRSLSLDWSEEKLGEAKQRVDPEVAAITEMTVAADRCAWIRSASSPWPWGEALAVLRGFEAGMRYSATAAKRYLELGQLEPNIRSVLSTLWTIQRCLSSIGARGGARKAALHAGLMAAIHDGHAGRLRKMLDDEPFHGLSTHRLDTLSLAMAASAATGKPTSHAGSLVELVQFAATLEAERVVTGLSRSDCLARALTRKHPSRWIVLVIASEGLVPAGASVVLRDGTRGVSLGPSDSGDPWRPTVLVQGRVLVPDGPVRLA